jgi:hypothetical protein
MRLPRDKQAVSGVIKTFLKGVDQMFLNNRHTRCNYSVGIQPSEAPAGG